MIHWRQKDMHVMRPGCFHCSKPNNLFSSSIVRESVVSDPFSFRLHSVLWILNHAGQEYSIGRNRVIFGDHPSFMCLQVAATCV